MQFSIQQQEAAPEATLASEAFALWDNGHCLQQLPQLDGQERAQLTEALSLPLAEEARRVVQQQASQASLALGDL